MKKITEVQAFGFPEGRKPFSEPPIQYGKHQRDEIYAGLFIYVMRNRYSGEAIERVKEIKTLMSEDRLTEAYQVMALHSPAGGCVL